MATCDTDLPQQYVGRRGIRCTWHGESFLPGFRFRSHGLETRLYNRTTPYMDCTVTHGSWSHHDINHQITYPKQQEGLTLISVHAQAHCQTHGRPHKCRWSLVLATSFHNKTVNPVRDASCDHTISHVLPPKAPGCRLLSTYAGAP